MTTHTIPALRLNRVYLPIMGFIKKYKSLGKTVWFRDVTSFEFIVEALIAHSASEIVLESYGEKLDGKLLNNVPQALRKRIKFVDKDRSALKLATAVISPVFDEYSVEPQGLALAFKKEMADHELDNAIATSYWSLYPFVLGLRHKLEVDIDIGMFKKAVSTIRRKSKNSEARANMSILEGVLNCYSPFTIDALNIVPRATREQAELFINLLEDSSFKELSRASFGLGLPIYFRKSLLRIKQGVRKIVSSERFKPLVNASSKSITAATRVPLPDADLIKSMVTSDYLPPIVSLKPILEQARTVWEGQYGDKNLAERYQRLESMFEP